ncbi:MAG: SOS response-associated peptidase [Dehalococcoidales bacterium]|nr:MAG: SOS response-associated peptidase [Dehalococcoidales bacterium]
MYNMYVCYYISITTKPTDIMKRLSFEFPSSESFQPMYSVNAFTYPEIPVISSEDRQHVLYYTWGLIPFWVKDKYAANQIRQRTLNARAETIFEKPSFRHSIRNKRCLILVDGFYEWRHIGKKTYPYHINLKSNEPFAIAGIWDTWTDPGNGEIIKTCSIITTTANTLLEKVHNTRKRMPVILKKEYEKNWLEDGLSDDDIIPMLLPYEADAMTAYPVPKTLNKLGVNTSDESVLKEFKYPELPGL